MTDFVKKKRESEEIPKSEKSEEIDLNKEIFIGQVVSDDNTICTRGTESSIITILRNSRREHFFDARMKLYREKLILMEKQGRMRLSSGLNARERISGCCKANKYKVYRILITILGVTFLLLALFGVTFLALLPKFAEIQIRNSRMEIREIDIFQLSRRNKETSFEVDSVLYIDDVSKYRAQFIHSLMQISYGIGEDARQLGELYVSRLTVNQDGSFTARGRFTIKSKDSVNELINYIALAMSGGQADQDLEKKITFYGKGLMSLRIFGILVNNISVKREMSYLLPSGVTQGVMGDSTSSDGSRKRISHESGSLLQHSGFKMHNIWLHTNRANGPMIHLEFELDIDKFLGGGSEKKGQGLLFPKFHMENIGNLLFDVTFKNEHIAKVTWYDANLRPGNNLWNISLQFPEKLNDGLKSLIMEIIQSNDISRESITIRGESSGSEAFSPIFKDLEINIPLSMIKGLIESEFKEVDSENEKVGLINKLVQFIQVSHIQISHDSEDLSIHAHAKAGYVNPLGNNLPISLNSMIVTSQLVDKNNYYGDVILRINEVHPEGHISAFRRLSEPQKEDSSIINMIEATGRDPIQRRAPKMQSKHGPFVGIKEESKHINKCNPISTEEINEPLKLNACYNIQEFDVDIKINTDKVKPEVKSRWLENIVFNHRKLEIVESSIDAEITSIFGEANFNGIKIKRNLLVNKNKLQLSGIEDGFLDDGDYNFDDYYKEDDESDDIVESFSIKNLTSLIDSNNIQILGEGFNNSWITKVKIDNSEILPKLGLDKLEVGPLGILIKFDNSNIGFIGTNNFKIGKNSTIELLGVIKPEYDTSSRELSHSLTQFIKSIITGDKSEIHGKNFSLEFNTNESSKENCMRYFNYPHYLSEEEFTIWLRNGTLPPVNEIKKPEKKRKGWIGKLLDGQHIEIPATVFDDFNELNIQKYLDKGMENNSNLIRESLCRVQSIFNDHIEFENNVDYDRNEIKKAINDKLKEKNILLSNMMLQLFMSNRENDLEIPIGGVFDLRVPNIISKELYMAILSINYKLQVYEKTSKRSILEFESLQNFQELNVGSENQTNKKEKVEHLDMRFNFDNPILKLNDDNHQFTNTLYSLLHLPDLISERIVDLVIESTIDIVLESSIGVLKLDNIILTANTMIPECRRKAILENSAQGKETSIHSIFKVDSIQVQKIRLILPPRGIDIQLNTVIKIPNYVESMKMDVIMGQCIFELKNKEDHLLAIIKTPKQLIVGNNRVTESVFHGFVPAKSWLPMMNLIGNEENNQENLHINAINTPHGIPYWLVPVFGFLKLPASSTLNSLESTEFGSVTFS
ncbi:hypothetical protein OJ253_2915 [Cryptosporidium canis]|uniref:Transmembrane protein n=1 Tax=Cryptosporidium canis TaxID=195482 RepID=A0A9D5HWK4_9CRYT|nr:hypothetical protein OJ253_2915 [Cryptosporidium canis]